jgi:RimJ/RimL family protein N-acetyltransferase
MEVLTPRLRLRQWVDTDLEPFAALNADPQVMAFFPSVLERAHSDAMAAHCRDEIEARGWGFWAVELRSTGEFIGFAGLQEPLLPMPFDPAVEVGWCLARAHWGHGYATEAATHALSVGFDWLGLERVVSFTTLGNERSVAVMRRLGMTPLMARFEHPALPVDSPLRPHCLYGLDRQAWDRRPDPADASGTKLDRVEPVLVPA